MDAMHTNGESNRLYFLGSIVLVKTPGESEARVVDGQQRLTTLTILFSVLRDLTENAELQFSRDTYIKQAASKDLGRPDRLRLHLRERDQDFFEKRFSDATRPLICRTSAVSKGVEPI